jgi:hypothetical protein
MSAPQQLRLVGSKRESTNVRTETRQRAQKARLAFEYDNTQAAFQFIQRSNRSSSPKVGRSG